MSCYSQDGTLDTSFGKGGKVFLPYTTIYWNKGSSIIIQPDGKSIILGFGENPFGNRSFVTYFICRLNTDGSLDNSFGNSGVVTIPMGLGESEITGKELALRPDGKIVFTASDFSIYPYDALMVVQLNSNGTFDQSFGTNGRAYINFGYNLQIGRNIALQNDGKIIAGGLLSTNNRISGICRLNIDGSLDNTFGSGGKLIFDQSFYFYDINVIKVLSDNKILLGGNTIINNYTRYAIVRLNSDGSYDKSFNNSGTELITMGSLSDYLTDIDIQNDCKIVAAGFSQHITPEEKMSVCRINPDGSLDNTFNGTGYKLIGNGTSWNHLYSVKVLNDGKIVLSGDCNYRENNHFDFSIVKLTSDGSFDNSFGTNGTVYYDWEPSNEANDYIFDAAIQSDGKIIEIGESSPSLDFKASVIRLNNTVGPPPPGSTCAPAIQISSDKQSLCNAGDNVSFTAITTNTNGVITYQWKKNQLPVGSNNSTLTLFVGKGDTIECDLTSECCKGPVTVQSNTINIPVIEDTLPKISISTNNLSVCKGSNVQITASNLSGNANPHYQWKLDGFDAGSDSSTFNYEINTDSAGIYCIMSVPSCSGSLLRDTTSSVIIHAYNPLQPSILIQSDKDSACQGNSIVFTAIAKDAGLHPSYQWKINGLPVGTNDALYSSTSLSNKDSISCDLVIDPSVVCYSSLNATSNIIHIKIVQPVQPSIQIQSSMSSICGSVPVFFKSIVSDKDSSLHYDWYVNGKAIGINTPDFSFSKPGNGDSVYCKITEWSQKCKSQVSAISNPITIKVKNPPIISIQPSDTTIFSGNSVNLKVKITGTNQSFTWSPSGSLINPQTLSPVTTQLTANTKFRIEVLSSDSCISTAEAFVRIENKLFIPNSFTPNGDGKNDIFRIPPGTALQLTEFSIYNRWGNRIFYTNDINKGWDGKYKGVLLDNGVFVYHITGKLLGKDVEFKGSFLLIR